MISVMMSGPTHQKSGGETFVASRQTDRCLALQTTGPSNHGRTPVGRHHLGDRLLSEADVVAWARARAVVQVAVMGRTVHAKLTKLKTFVVGAGALGCEPALHDRLFSCCKRQGVLHRTPAQGAP
jgi:hypothetical protein